TTGKGELLTRILEGEVLNNTINAIASSVFKDKDGNAVFPMLNADGAIVVANDPGTAYSLSDVFALVDQTIDTREKALEIALAVDALNEILYTKPDFKVTCFSECLVEMEAIIDEGEVTEAIIPLGYAATNDMIVNDEQKIKNNKFAVPAGALTASLRLMVTPYEDGNQGDDIRLSMSVNKIEAA